MTSATTTTQRFDRLASNATCGLVDINEHLLCALCSGYLVDATTIIECLHTFCRSCIIRYLESSETCPVCDVPLHQTNPLLGIRSDTTLQTLVYKLVPGIYKDEVKRRCAVINNADADGKPASIMDRLLKDICDMTTGGTVYTGDEKFSVCLQYSPSHDSVSSANSFKELCSMDAANSNCQKLQQDPTDCNYFLCPASLTVAHLKKLIRNKLELSPDLPLELYHSSRDGSLDDSYSLADVAYITAWTSVKPLHFVYRVIVRGSQTSSNETGSPQTTLSASQKSNCKSEKGCESISKQTNDPRSHKTKAKYAHLSSSSSAKGKLSNSSTATKAKPPPGKCLSTKTFAMQNFFSSKKSLPRVKKTVKSKSDSCSGKANGVQKSEEIKMNSSEEKESVILLEEDTLENYPIQTNESDLLESELETVRKHPSKRPFSEVTSDIGPLRERPVVAVCNNSADSALSPSRPELVTQSTLTSDNSDTMSDVESNAIDSASSPLPPKKKTKKTDPAPNDRNLFAVINSMIVGKNNNNNDNVVSSSTSSQVSADDSSDSSTNKTSVETQTNVKFISRKIKKSKIRSKREPLKSSLFKHKEVVEDATITEKQPSTEPADSAHTSNQSISVATHTYSSTVATPSASTTLCVPICIGDKGSNLILNLPQNVSVECRIRSDKILIASSPSAINPEVVASFSSISYSETTTINADQNKSTFKAPEVVSPPVLLTTPTTTTDKSTSISTTNFSPKCAESAFNSETSTGTAGDDTYVAVEKQENKAKTVTATNLSESNVAKCANNINSVDTVNVNTNVSAQIHRNATEQSKISRGTTSDLRSRDQDPKVSISRVAKVLSNEVLTSSNSLSSSVAATTPTAVTLGRSFCGGIPTRLPSSSDNPDPVISGKMPLCDTAKCSTLNPIVTEAPKSVTKQKPVQSVLPNISKVSSSSPDTSISSNPVDVTSAYANKVVLFKPYQIAETKSAKHTAEELTVTAGVQQNTQTAAALYSNSQFPVYPIFSYTGRQPVLSGIEEDAERYRRLLNDSALTVANNLGEQKPGMSAMHCTASNIPLRNVIKVPIYTASCTRKTQMSRKSEKKTTTGAKTVQGLNVRIPTDSEACLQNKEVVEDPKLLSVGKLDTAAIACGSQRAVKTPRSPGASSSERKDAMSSTEETKAETKILSQEPRTQTKNSPRANLKLPLIDNHQRDSSDSSNCTISTSEGERAAPLADDSEVARKFYSVKRQRSEHIGSTPKSRNDGQSYSSRRKSERSSALDEMTYTRAEADSGTSPGVMGASPPRCGSSKSDGHKEGTATYHRSANNSPVRKKLVIDLERCSPRQSISSECTSRPSTKTSFDTPKLQCCSPTTTLQPAAEAKAARQTPPAKLIISLPRCQIPSAVPVSADPAGGLSQWSPPTSSGETNSPPTTKRLKLMCNGMTIYRTLENPGSRSRNASGGGGRKSSPVSSPVLDCPPSGISLLATQSLSKTPSQSKYRRKSSGHSGAAIVTSGEASVVVSVDSTSASPRSGAATTPSSNNDSLYTASSWKGLERSVSLPGPDSIDAPLELTTKVVRERQKEREYEKLMSSRQPAFPT